jgi:cytochrome c oxidase cbb3-type subunit 3
MCRAPIASILALVVAAADGKVLYETKCAQCHGKDGVAKPPGRGSKNFDDPAFQAAWTEESIAKITAEGNGKMPGYRSKLSPEQIRAIAAHVKTLGPSK